MKLINQQLTLGFLVLSFAPISPAAMGDDPLLGKFMLYKFETTDEDGDSPLNWGFDAWLGKDFNKLWIKSEGERIDGASEQSNELLFSRAFAPFWDVQMGYRQDRADSNERDFFSIGVSGLMPYLIETDTSLVFGENDQIGFSTNFEYELMLTQRWVILPELEFSIWSEDDPEIGIGSGLSEAEFGLRLGYEIRREFMPYIGILWNKQFGNTADFASEEGEDTESTQFVAGLKIWL